MTCHARQFSDQMVCHVCTLRWDMNDAYPPSCDVALKPEFNRQWGHMQIGDICTGANGEVELLELTEVLPSGEPIFRIRILENNNEGLVNGKFLTPI